MAIFNDFYPVDFYSDDIPTGFKEKAAVSVALVCAVGQDFLDDRNGKLRSKTTGYYYDKSEYEEGYIGKLCDNIAQKVAVWVTGTAFAVNDKTWITPKHVVEEALRDAEKKEKAFTELRLITGFYIPRNTIDPKFKYSMYEVTKVEYHPKSEVDVCRLTTKPPIKEKKLTFDVAQGYPRVGQNISMVGYPLGQAMKYTEGVVAEVDAESTSFFAYISNFEGNSGGPVIDPRTGEVLGMLTKGNGKNWEKPNDECVRYKKYDNDIEHHAGIVYAKHFKW